MKKFVSILIVTALLLLSVTVVPVSAYTLPAEYEIHARSAMLVSLDTGGVLYEKNSDEVTYPASLQKIMVALLIFERETDYNKVITASETAINDLLGTGAAVSNIKPGEEMTVKDLLYCLLVPSACDAANVLAEAYGGTMEAFVDQMNERAEQLGMKSTHYANASGLHDDNQYTTAQDLLILVKEAMKHPMFMEICTVTRYTVEATNKSEKRILVSTNFMMDKTTSYYYKYVKGIKTGNTDKAGRCLITTAEKDGASYLCIVLGCPPKDEKGASVRYEFADTRALYTWAFDNLVSADVVELGKPVAEIKVELAKQQDYIQLVPEEKLTAIVPKGAESSVILEPTLSAQSVQAPITKGDVLGYAVVKCAGEELGRVNLVAAASLERSNVLYVFSKIKAFFSHPLFLLAVIALFILLIIAIVINIIHNKRRRRSRRVRSHRRM